MSCCNCKECACKKTVFDWLRSIVEADGSSKGMIRLDFSDKKEAYLKYEFGEFAGGSGMELEFYDMIVDQVEISPSPCTEGTINYILHIKE